MVKFTWKNRNRLNGKINQVSDFSDFYFSSHAEKNTVAENSLDAVEREPVLTGVLNPKACGVQGGEAPSKKKHKYFFEEFFVFKFTWISDLTNFYFSSYGHFSVILWRHHHNSCDNSKNKNRGIFLLFFSFYSAHSASFIKFHHFWEEGGLHILNWEKAQLLIFIFINLYCSCFIFCWTNLDLIIYFMYTQA